MKWTEAESEQIVKAVGRVLADSKFNTSQRCVELLRHLVDYALKGEHDRVKERTIGIEVFGRDPEYDVNADPIVRRTAAELRKRLAQYYQDSEGPYPVRIRLGLGSYLPQFHFGDPVLGSFGEAERKEMVGPLSNYAAEVRLSARAVRSRKAVRSLCIWGGALLLATLGAAFWLWHVNFWRSTGYMVWKPFLGSNQGLFVCIPDDHLTQAIKLTHPQIDHSDARPHPGGDGGQAATNSNALAKVSFIDAMNAARINTRLAAFGSAIALRSSSQVRLHQFRRRAIVLVGGFNNPWSMSELADLRYSLQADEAAGKRWIQDAKDPASRSWQISGESEKTPVDYAVITRFWDANTSGWMMVVSGLGPFGTEAAVILLTDPAMENLLPANLRTAKNFQLVLKASVIDGSDGSPRILAVHTW